MHHNRRLPSLQGQADHHGGRFIKDERKDEIAQPATWNGLEVLTWEGPVTE